MYNKLQVIVHMQACVYVFIYTFFFNFVLRTLELKK